jgi:hypothetical protein
MGSSITTTINTTVYLEGPTYPNPVNAKGYPAEQSPLVIGLHGKVAPSAAGANGVYSDVAGVSLTLDAGLGYGTSGTPGGYVVGAAGSGGTNGGIGVDLLMQATVTNGYQIVGGVGDSGANGGAGLSMTGGGTLVNDFFITGGGANSDSSGEGGAGVVMAGGTITNDNFIQGGYSNADLAGITGGIGLELLSNATVTNESGGKIAGGGGGLGNAGGAGVDLSSGTLTNAGTIEGGVGGNGATGGVGVEFNGGTLTDSGKIEGAVTNSFTADSVKFGTAAVTMTLESGATLTGDIGGFTVVGDTIDITNWDPMDPAASFNTAHTALTTTDGTLHFAYSLAGDYKFTPDSGGTGTDLTITSTVAACYRRGTRIRTPAGEVPIETLRIGDVVTTLWGDTRAIRWIGRRSYSAAYAANNDAVAPIRIRAGALAENVPQRDLWVSPEHAMWIDGVLIPARALVNKSSIIRETAVADLTYIHLEFDAHEVIYAEGAPSESFVDDESREQFDNAREYRRLYPDATRQPARFCAPRVEDGAELEAVLERLRARVRETVTAVRSAERERPRLRLARARAPSACV